MPIQILSSEVASQIAAGEVVERPASVVKELLENALDAGATRIQINIEGAGQKLVEISDDGSGIPEPELRLAVERHATSKLHDAQDLFNITSLGFRGEALASIASVSRLTITSRVEQAQAGARLRVEGGAAGVVEPIGAPPGTLVRVENLFYNVPARLKFLKSDQTERRQIDQLVTRYALAYPHTRFHLSQDGRPSLQTSGNGERREVLAALYGVEIARAMLDVISDEGGLKTAGYISPTSLTRSNRREITFFVNGRPVQDSALSAALLQAYHTLLMVGRYPLAVLFLELTPDAVDVNVHPAKAEVRFREPERIFSGVQRAVRRALLAHSAVPGLELPGAWSDRSAAATAYTAPLWPRPQFNPTSDFLLSTPPSGPTDGSLSPDSQTPTSTPLSILRLVGQIAATYLVAEGPDGLYLIDQHAAHERVLFEQMLAQRSGAIPSQTLLQPVVVELTPASARLLIEQLDILARLGFLVEPFGPASFLVRAIPALLNRLEPAAALRVLVEDFEEDETPLQAEAEARIIARVCKRAAVKAGQVLTLEEQRALLSGLEASQSPRTCPHGRPTMVHLSVDLLERQFGRRGAR